MKFNPNDADAYVQLGHVYQSLKRYPDAVTAYRQATTLRPEDFNAYLSLGDVSMRVEDYEGATQAYRHATDIDPKNAEAYKSLAIAYRMSKKYVEAKQSLRTARRLGEGLPRPYTVELCPRAAHCVGRQPARGASARRQACGSARTPRP